MIITKAVKADTWFKTPPKNNSPVTWPYDVHHPLEGFGGMVFERMAVIAGNREEYDFCYHNYLGSLRPYTFYVETDRDIFGCEHTLFALYGTFVTRPLYLFTNLVGVCSNPLIQNAVVYLDWIEWLKNNRSKTF